MPPTTHPETGDYQAKCQSRQQRAASMSGVLGPGSPAAGRASAGSRRNRHRPRAPLLTVEHRDPLVLQPEDVDQQAHADHHRASSGSTPAEGCSPRQAEPPSRPGPAAGPADLARPAPPVTMNTSIHRHCVTVNTIASACTPTPAVRPHRKRRRHGHFEYPGNKREHRAAVRAGRPPRQRRTRTVPDTGSDLPTSQHPTPWHRQNPPASPGRRNPP